MSVTTFMNDPFFTTQLTVDTLALIVRSEESLHIMVFLKKMFLNPETQILDMFLPNVLEAVSQQLNKILFIFS
jgi:hypothetical protein